MQANEIPVNLLPEIYQDIAQAVGIDAALALGQEYGGMSLYLPKMDSAIRGWRDESIRREFTGANVAQLARKHRLTATRVRQILGEK